MAVLRCGARPRQREPARAASGAASTRPPTAAKRSRRPGDARAVAVRHRPRARRRRRSRARPRRRPRARRRSRSARRAVWRSRFVAPSRTSDPNSGCRRDRDRTPACPRPRRPRPRPAGCRRRWPARSRARRGGSPGRARASRPAPPAPALGVLGVPARRLVVDAGQPRGELRLQRDRLQLVALDVVQVAREAQPLAQHRDLAGLRARLVQPQRDVPDPHLEDAGEREGAGRKAPAAPASTHRGERTDGERGETAAADDQPPPTRPTPKAAPQTSAGERQHPHPVRLPGDQRAPQHQRRPPPPRPPARGERGAP